MVGGVDEGGELGARTGHAGGLEEGVGAELLPAGALGAGDGLGGRGEPEVGVGVARPERVEGLQPHVVEDVRLVVAEVFEEVAGVVGEAAAVGEQVGGGDVVGDPGVLQGEPGQDGAVVPLLGVGEGAGHDRGGDGLGHRSELEDGVGADLAALAGLAEPVALDVDDLVVMDHGHGHAGDPGAAHHVRDGAVEAGDGLVDGGVRDLGLRGGGRAGRGRGRAHGRDAGRRGQEDRGPCCPERGERTHEAIVLPGAAVRALPLPGAPPADPRPSNAGGAGRGRGETFTRLRGVPVRPRPRRSSRA